MTHHPLLDNPVIISSLYYINLFFVVIVRNRNELSEPEKKGKKI